MAHTFHVYIVRCSDGSLYVGHTDDIERRLSEHDLGLSDGYTRSRRPLKLVHSEAYRSRDEAFHRERQIKGWSKGEKEALVRGDSLSLIGLSKERTGLRKLRFDDWSTDLGQGAEVVLRQAQDERA